MKAVSEAYKASMKKPLRNLSHVIIQFGNVDTTAPADGSWEANGVMPWSEFSTLDYSYNYDSAPYATMELNRWLGNGAFDLVPASDYSNQGYCSSKVSGESGAFTAAPLLTRPFTLEHTMPGVTITFDTICGEWPRAMTVRFYKSGSVVDTQTLSGITGPTVEIPTRAASIDKIEVQFNELLPYRRPRVERVMYGVEMRFTDEDIISVKQSHDVDPLSRRLPKESFSFTIHDYAKKYDPDNPLGIYAYIDIHSPISVQYGYELDDGVVEWLHPDNYVLDGKPTVKDYKATFKGTGLIGSLKNTYYKGTFGQKSFYAMAEAVLLDAGLTLRADGSNPWDIDDDLKAMYCSNPLPKDTHMNCLQLIANACRSRLFTDEDNIIHIRPFGVSIRGIYTGTWDSNGEEPYSEWDSVDKETVYGETYATLELNRWLGDGTQNIIPGTTGYTLQGYVSSIVSGSDGAFATAPVASRLFQVPHDLPTVRIRFDTRCGEWPRSITVRYWRDGQVVLTKPITGIVDKQITVSTDVTECDSFDLVFSEMLPYRRPRVEMVNYRETDFLLDFKTITENTLATTKTDELKDLSVAMYQYTPDDKTSVLYQGSTTNTYLHAAFKGMAKDVQVSVSGGTLISSAIYAQAADLVLSEGTKTVTITGVKQNEVSDVCIFHANQNGEDDKEENPLISEEGMRTALAAHFISYLGLRSTYNASYRGNPELEVGDLIQAQTNYTTEMDALVLTDELNYNGTLSGKVKVKGIV